MTLSKQLINYIKDLTLYGGDCDGQKFTILPWERQFLKGAVPPPYAGGRSKVKSALLT